MRAWVGVVIVGCGGMTVASKDSGADAYEPVGISCLHGDFPQLDRTCAADTDCTYGLHAIDCCGTKHALGFNARSRTVFDRAEDAWFGPKADCACLCNPGPTQADQGQARAGADISVLCTAGVCTTYSK